MGYFNLKTKGKVLEETVQNLSTLVAFKDYFQDKGMMHEYHKVTTVIQARVNLERKTRKIEESIA